MNEPEAQSSLPAIQRAVWRYNEDADEMELLLPGYEGRAILVNDEFYVRIDVETRRPLTIIIPGYTSWLADKLSQPEMMEKLPLLKARVTSARAAAARRRATEAALQQAFTKNWAGRGF